MKFDRKEIQHVISCLRSLCAQVCRAFSPAYGQDDLEHGLGKRDGDQLLFLGGQGNAETLIVDCGITPALANRMQLGDYVNPVEVLARMGVEASTAKRVILTHINFDHVSGIELFPMATVYVQGKVFENCNNMTA